MTTVQPTRPHPDSRQTLSGAQVLGSAADREPTDTSTLDMAFAALRRRLTGSLLQPDDADYAQAATPWNVAVPSAPAAVVRAADADDVVAALQFAAQQGLLVDVRATGHGAAPTDGHTLLLHTGDLDELQVHPDGWVRAGAGVRWEQVIAATPAGWAALCGSAPHVGVVGYLTGGGLGPLARSVGISSDYVRAFEVVTGDGHFRRATPTENPALFWALCGGKGAVGVVTAVEFNLFPLDALFGGALYFDGADAAAVLHAWRSWVADLPEQGTSSVAVLNLPPLPSVPPPLAGRTTVAVRFAWTGDHRTGAAVVAPMLQVAPVVLGGVGSLPYTEIGSVHADPVDPMPATESTELLHSLPVEAVDALLEQVGPESGNPQVIVELRQLGGAIARRPDRGDALGHRDAAFQLIAIGIGVPPLVGSAQEHAARLSRALAPWVTGGAFPNFGGAATAESVRRCYSPEVLNRLASLSAAYDPRGVLACGRPVRAAAAVIDRGLV